jgi:redox-sensitive bicupin YhaK (pirin superfamily)
MLFKAPRSKLRREMGPFTIITNLPGRAIPGHRDHGYGPLARFDESVLEPGGFIPMHEHRNDEIISYVSDGMIYHTDTARRELPISPSQIMV